MANVKYISYEEAVQCIVDTANQKTITNRKSITRRIDM